MGSDLAVAPQHAVGKQTLSTSDDAATPATPGKRTLTDQAPGLAGDVVTRVKAYAGETISDGGGYTFRVTDAGAFEITGTPAGGEKSMHVEITLEKSAHAWQVVAQRLLARPPIKAPVAPAPKPADAPAPAPQPSWFSRAIDAVEAELDSLHQDASSIWSQAKSYVSANDPPAATPSSTPATPATTTPAKPATPASATKPADPSLDDERTKSGGHVTLKAIPLAIGDVARVSPYSSNGGAKLVTQKNRFEQPGTKEMLACETYVRITAVDGDIVQVDQLDGPSAPAGTSFGWVRKNKLVRLNRAPRPTAAAAQMARLADIASTNHAAAQQELCFTYVKNYVALAGGYGDILDIHTDPRFDGMGIGGQDFAAQVEKIGLAELGLERVGGAIADQKRGTIVCTRGNGKNGISAQYGDIAVVDKTEAGVTICYNDGIIKFLTAEKEWQAGGTLEGSIVAMYRAIDRA